MNSQEFPPGESFDAYHSFGSNSSSWQDSSTRFRAQGHYQGTLYFKSFSTIDFFSVGPYPTSNTRMRQHGG